MTDTTAAHSATEKANLQKERTKEEAEEPIAV